MAKWNLKNTLLILAAVGGACVWQLLKKKKEEIGFEEEYVCYECGSKMEKADDEVMYCPNCNHSVDIYDYGDEEEVYSNIYGSSINDEPDCCRACGGPWPSCEISCKIFDD